jgi:hypothetical protein
MSPGTDADAGIPSPASTVLWSVLVLVGLLALGWPVLQLIDLLR